MLTTRSVVMASGGAACYMPSISTCYRHGSPTLGLRERFLPLHAQHRHLLLF